MTTKLQANIDGGARGNPGPAASAFVIRDQNGKVLRQAGLCIGQATNNIAEYKAMLAAMEAAIALAAQELEILSDSELLVRQMNGQYRVRNEGLLDLYEQAQTMLGKFSNVTFTHIPREQNKAADRLVNKALNLNKDVLE